MMRGTMLVKGRGIHRAKTGAPCAAAGKLALLAAVVAVGLAGCQSKSTRTAAKVDPKLGVAASPRVVAENKAVPRGGGRYHVGNPYTIAGRIYTPAENPNYEAVGVASYYGRAFHGRKTANGEVFDMHALSAAHPTLPLPSYVRVTNLDNDRSVIVRVNDRGPFAHGRLIDVSRRAADMLGFVKTGTAKVRVQYIEVARLDGADEKMLVASYRGPDLPRAPAPPGGRPQPVLVAYTGTAHPPGSGAAAPPGRIGEFVPASEVSAGVPFDPFAVLTGPGRYALTAPRPTRALFAAASPAGHGLSAYAAQPPRPAGFARHEAIRAIGRLASAR